MLFSIPVKERLRKSEWVDLKKEAAGVWYNNFRLIS